MLLTGIGLAKRTIYVAGLASIAAVANIGLNLALIPPFGIVGAALASTGGYWLLALLYYWAAQRVYPTPFEPLKVLAILALAIGASFAAALPLDGVLFVAAKLAAIAAFLAAVVASGAIRRDDLRELGGSPAGCSLAGDSLVQAEQPLALAVPGEARRDRLAATCSHRLGVHGVGEQRLDRGRDRIDVVRVDEHARLAHEPAPEGEVRRDDGDSGRHVLEQLDRQRLQVRLDGMQDEETQYATRARPRRHRPWTGGRAGRRARRRGRARRPRARRARAGPAHALVRSRPPSRGRRGSR